MNILFLAVQQGMGDFSSLTRDGTHAPCNAGVECQLLDHQGSLEEWSLNHWIDHQGSSCYECSCARFYEYGAFISLG